MKLMFLAKGLQLRDSDEMRRFLQVELPPPPKKKQKQGCLKHHLLLTLRGSLMSVEQFKSLHSNLLLVGNTVLEATMMSRDGQLLVYFASWQI